MKLIMMNSDKINLIFLVNDQLETDYLAILFEPQFINMSVMADGKNFTELLRKYQRSASVDLSFTLDEYH
jgi:hypothetical protein